MSLQTSRNIMMAAILMLLAGAQNIVTLSSQSLCVVTGSTVKIPCSTPYSSITERQWYQVQRSDGEPQDLSTNPQYSGRVSISPLRNDCTLTIKNVTGSDSGVYNFRLRTWWDEWISASSGVTLTVTDLQVKVDPETVGQREVKLTCSSTCNITETFWSLVLSTLWYWNGVFWLYRPGASILLNSTILDNQGSFSCRMSGSDHRSPTVYPPRNTRAVMVPSGERVEGDSVTLTCSSDANPPVLTYSWFKQRAAADTLLGTGQNYSITTISSQHSGLYYCTAHNQLGHHNSTTVLLDVLHPPRNTRAVMVPSGERVEGDSVTLTCSSDANPPVLTYSWFKQRAAADTLLETGQNYSITTISSQHSGLYYCTAHNQLGHHNSTTVLLDVLHPPRNTRAVMVPSGERVEGDSVTLTCSSDANPPVLTYSWFKQRAAADTLLGTGQNYSITTISSQYSGLYYCTAHNQLGQHNSTTVLLDVLHPPRNTRAVMVPSGERVEGDSVTLTCSSDANPPVLTYSWFKQRAAADTLLGTGQNYSITTISSQHSGLYYCTTHNQLGQHNSTTVLLDVLHPPRNTRAVMVPSGERVEGDSVILTCSSDANPPVLTYSWFKQRAAADTLLGTGQNYSITNISSQHSGLYYCTAHNQLGQHNSTTVLLDVLYPPRVPSVTDHVSGDSVTLLCYTDSNPISNYSWYKKTGSDVMLFGNGTNITLATGSSGRFYCVVKNTFGSSNSTEWLFASGSPAGTYTASGVSVGLFLTLTAVCLWMRRRAVSSRRDQTSANQDSAPVHDL
ncbi:B-cell receptor CD22-like [Brachyhypopomus gauderio]|uniref:B-cell receptor CD22-like n=1 Tax=Brachyhypopomus gauderio TaxID=698409 RepID=UPI0040424FFD